MPSTVSIDLPDESAELLKLAHQFEADYNAVDQFLRRALGKGEAEPFTTLVREYRKRHPGWKDEDMLVEVAKLRNAIVHRRSHQERYVAIPARFFAIQLSKCRESLERPELVLPTLQRKVQQLSSDDSLTKVLRLIAQLDYSQFPVYSGTDFSGLLTENGITRWLASHVSDISIVEFDDIKVSDLLATQETRSNFEFVAKKLHLRDIPVRFAENPELEAVFVTETGKAIEALIGVATRWDCLQLAKNSGAD